MPQYYHLVSLRESGMDGFNKLHGSIRGEAGPYLLAELGRDLELHPLGTLAPLLS